jgi:hypothetical protein
MQSGSAPSQNQNSTKKTYLTPLSAQAGAPELLGNLHGLRATVDEEFSSYAGDIPLAPIKYSADSTEND